MKELSNTEAELKKANYGKSLISIFEQFSACIDKILILEERLGTKLEFC